MSAASASAAGPFSVRTVAILVAVVLVGFAGFILLSAYGDDFRPASNGGAHVLSTSAVGFSGAAELVRITGGKAEVVRDEAGIDAAALLILTPGPDTPPERIAEILKRRYALPTLIVLPKWIVRPIETRPAWVESIATLPLPAAVQPLRDVAAEAGLRRTAGLRAIDGEGLRTLIEEPGGGPLLVEIGETAHMILADPDALNNHGLRTREGVARAIEILGYAKAYSDTGSIAFDATLAGFGRNPNLLKLAFEPPFLPLTLCLLLAAALAVLHALRRFGPAAREERAVAFGKLAIADNAAALLRLARRRHRTGARYAQLVRDAAAQATGAPAGLSGEALDRYLDRLTPEGEPYTSLAARAAEAPDTRRLLAAARDLYRWRRIVTREH